MSDKLDSILRKLNIEHWKAIAAVLIVFDVFAVNLSYLFSLWIRFDCRFRLIPDYYLNPFKKFAFIMHDPAKVRIYIIIILNIIFMI